jgi:purine-binding chemotaxis protein CheW
VQSVTQDSRSFVLFRLGDEEYGLPIERVRTIIRYEPPMPVPRAPDDVLGVINLRGRVVPVIDLTRRLRVGSFAPGHLSRVIITEGSVGEIGLVVDSASEVVSFPVESIGPVPESVLGPETQDLFEGVVERDQSLVILVDFERAMSKADYAHLEGATGAEGDRDV